MKILYLIPPSEGKNSGGMYDTEKLSFNFKKPLDIAINTTQKDLKCTGKRYEEGINLNKAMRSYSHTKTQSGILSLPEEKGTTANTTNIAVSRYSGVMYNAINYGELSENGKEYFDANFLILSGMYGLLRPQDRVANYKLPIETKGLKEFWGETITQALNDLNADMIVDLLPNSYKKIINWKKLDSQVIKIDFYKMQPLSPPKEKGFRIEGENEEENGMRIKKLTHGVKKVKGEYIRKICEKKYNTLEDFGGNLEKISENEYHILIITK